MTESFRLLVSSRLRLRPLELQDVPALHSHWTDPAVRRFLWDDEVIPETQVSDIIEESERLFRQHGYGLWALCNTDGLIGCGGYWTFHDPPQLELILSLSPAYWHQGLASEAATLLIDYAFGELGFPEVRASTDAPNTHSLRLL
ncbi:MAG: GNAT family N-acetyltransferase, partial [Bacteroidota bacterium]